MKPVPTKTALLTLDFQKRIFGFVPGADAIIPNAAKTVELARKKQVHMIHLGWDSPKAIPKFPTWNPLFRG
jgi:nicotinamidase-related amidase